MIKAKDSFLHWIPMRCIMKFKIKLLPYLALIIVPNICSVSIAEVTESQMTANESEPQSSLSKFAANLKDSKLMTTLNVPTSSISKGLILNGSYSMDVTPSAAGKYSGVDVWNIQIGASTELFGSAEQSQNKMALIGSRQFTFIQQFDDLKSSLLRRPYDPLTKIPIKSEIFLKKVMNPLTQKIEPVIKDGDFFAFRAPLTLSLGLGKNILAAAQLGLDINLSWVLSGEFDIHIFKMNNDHVRIKIMAIKDQNRGGSVGLSILGFNPAGHLLVSKILGAHLLQLNFSTTKSELFTADYIFNLKKLESRLMYDNLIGHKMKSIDISAISAQFKNSNIFSKKLSMHQNLIADLSQLNAHATSDQNLPINERRLIHINSSKNEIKSSTHGVKINLLRLVKKSQQETTSASQVTVDTVGQESVQSTYLSEANTQSHLEQLLVLWGNSQSTMQSLLLKTDAQFKPTDLVGFSLNQTATQKRLTAEQYSDLKNSFTAGLPQSIASAIQWPAWNFGEKDTVRNAYVEQNIVVNENIFKMKFALSPKKIKSELIQILENTHQFKSLPMNTLAQIDGDALDQRSAAFHRGDYLNAYNNDWEQYVIPVKLAEVFDSTKTIDEKHKSYIYLMNNVPLFSEIRTKILLRLIPENLLPQFVTFKLTVSAQKQTAIENYYPSKEVYLKSNIFHLINEQTEFLLKRTYDLRNFLKEDGAIYSAQEIISQASGQ